MIYNIETQETDEAILLKLSFLTALKMRIGDQKIDVIIKKPGDNLLIYEARTTGIQLI